MNMVLMQRVHATKIISATDSAADVSGTFCIFRLAFTIAFISP